MLLAGAAAAIALYLGHIVGRVIDAIAEEETGLRRSAGREGNAGQFAEIARKPEFILLMLTALIAAHGGSWRTGLPLCLAGLSIARLPKYIALWPRAVDIGAEWQVVLAVVLSTGLSLMSAICMFAIGACAGFLVR